MRVLHVQKVSSISGSEHHLLTLLPRLIEGGVDQAMCVIEAPGGGQFTREMSDRGVPTVAVPAGRDIDPLLPRRIGRVLRRFRPDLVHTHLIHSDIYGQAAAAVGRVPAVSTQHSTNLVYWPRLIRAVIRMSLRRSRAVVAVSAHVARALREFRIVDPDRIRVIHHGIDVRAWEVDERARTSFRHSLGCGDHDLVVGVASRMFPNKGHDLLIDAFAKVCDQRSDVFLAVAGDGPLRPSLEDLGERTLPRGRSSFLGHVREIQTFVNACDIVCFPTQPGFGEGFGMTVLEAMAAGRPVAATKVDSLPELITHDQTGLLIAPGDVDGFSEAILRLAGDDALRRRLGDNARRSAEDAFGLESMVAGTLSLYSEVL